MYSRVAVCVTVSGVDLGGLMSFRVIDLGVMVPCDKILREAITQKAGTHFTLDIVSVRCCPHHLIQVLYLCNRTLVGKTELMKMKLLPHFVHAS